MTINSTNINQSVLNEILLNRNYLTKGFEEFRVELLDYARKYFPDKIQDFTEGGVGGMLLDFAAIVGDSLSFYMDHQFNELNPNTAVERRNIENHIRRAGIKAVPSSPSIAEVIIEVRVELLPNSENINTTQLPKILKNLKLNSSRGIDFYLLENADFNEGYDLQQINTTATIPFAVLTKRVLAVSGNRETIAINLSNASTQFPTVTLPNRNITMIEKVIDDLNNEYYEVEFLTQDTVYKSTVINQNGEKYYEVIPAPYRFTREDQLTSGITVLRFGSGDKDSIMQPSIIQDPTKSALSLYGRDYFPKFSFDPGSLLKTNSLGIAPKGNIYITYSYGGGLNHNIPAYSINKIADYSNIVFNDIPIEQQDFVLNNISVYNDKPSTGGLNGLTFQQLQSQLNNAIKMQNRIVNYQDLLSKIYSMPSSFGKVAKISLEDDPNNIYAKNLYVLCFDENQKLTFANDFLKRNLSNYLNEFRLIGDSFNILDAKIFNITVELKIRIKEGSDPGLIASNVKSRIQNYFITKQFEINQPIILDEIYNIAINTNDVYSIANRKENFINQKKGRYNAPIIDQGRYPEGLIYSNETINIQKQIYKDVLYPTKGGIFELKFLDADIIVQVVA